MFLKNVKLAILVCLSLSLTAYAEDNRSTVNRFTCSVDKHGAHLGEVTANFGSSDLVRVGNSNLYLSGHNYGDELFLFGFEEPGNWDSGGVTLTRPYPRKISFLMYTQSDQQAVNVSCNLH
jgi:hypothetical protein